MGIVIGILVVVLVIALATIYLDRDHIAGAIEASEVKVATYAHEFITKREEALKQRISELEQRIEEFEKKYAIPH